MARFNNLGKAIGIAIQKDEQGIRQLLKRNGVDTSNIRTKQQLSDAFVEALFKSKGLAKDFSDYIKSKVSAESNFDGGYKNLVEPVSVLQPTGLSGLTIEPIKINTATTSTVTATETPQKAGFFSGLNLADLINLAGTVYVTESTKPDAINQTKVGATSVINSDYNGQPKSSNTGLYVLLGIVGLIAVGTVVFFVKKKK